MSNAKSANRFRLMVVLAIVIALALGSSWLALVMQKSLSDSSPKTERNDPDYFIENFSYVRMTPQGQPRYHVTGDLLTHFPLEDSFLIERPVVVSIGSQAQRQTMVSDRAVVEDENRKVHMHGNVVVDRPAAQKTDAFHMTTDYLLLFPDEDIMQTPSDVAIKRGTSTLTGTGMFANNVTRELRILNQTRVLFEARQKPAP